MRALAFVIFLSIIWLPLSACGQKGPLYLPEELPEKPNEEAPNQ